MKIRTGPFSGQQADYLDDSQAGLYNQPHKTIAAAASELQMKEAHLSGAGGGV